MRTTKDLTPSAWSEDLPGIKELASRLRFSFSDAQIWLDEERMMLLHSSSLAALRQELIDTLGMERTRGLITRMGFAAGTRDAQLVKKFYPHDSDLEIMHKGPMLHMLEGIVKVEPIKLNINIAKGIYDVEGRWTNSIEGQIHRQIFENEEGPVCWMELGYATGYVSSIMGKFILHAETECSANGCIYVGKTLEAWGDIEHELKYYQADPIADQIIQLQSQVEGLRQSLSEEINSADLIGVSRGFKTAWDLVCKAAKSAVTVLLLGETGVGKELFAKALHKVSDRSEMPFVSVNCAALPEQLIEAELFGVAKGAYTGAHQSREGRFERAHRGTLFLDEVGELTLPAQAKLLRALQEGEIERVGGTETKKIDVRVIAATNVDLAHAVQEGRFRRDLYFRLNVYPIMLPPLRNRKEDVPALVKRFLGKYTVREGKRLKGITDKAMHALMEYDWPGNIRELENVIERGVILAPNDGWLDADSVYIQSSAVMQESTLTALDENGSLACNEANEAKRFLQYILKKKIKMEDVENLLLDAAIEHADGNLSAAARLLGISRSQIAYKTRKRNELA